jgi:purine-nucleoside phosphorylase
MTAPRIFCVAGGVPKRRRSATPKSHFDRIERGTYNGSAPGRFIAWLAVRKGDAVTEQFTRGHFERAADIIRTQFTGTPRIAIILGSGLNALANEVEASVAVPYDKIPNFPVTNVEGHHGQLLFGTLEGHQVLLMQGRAHYYEGWSMPAITFPVRVMQTLGIETLIVSNAAGALNMSYAVGDLMLITDHIGLLNLAGLNPLRGPNDPSLGPRFPDMTQVYDPGLQQLARDAAAGAGTRPPRRRLRGGGWTIL